MSSLTSIEIKPRQSFDPEVFRTSDQFAARSIALDGFVKGPPKRFITRDGGYRLNFDHHHDVERLATRSTAGQVLMALKLGLAEKLDGAVVYVNDCDQDVALATWMLKNPHRIVDTSEPLLNKLLWAEDALDSTGGAYPFPKASEFRQTLHWIFEPYENARAAGRVPEMAEYEMRNVLEATWQRIDDYLLGAAGKKGEAAWGTWRVIEEHLYSPTSSCRFGMVIEVGYGARQAIAQRSGYDAFIGVRSAIERPDGSLHPEPPYFYTLVVLKPFAFFPMEEVYAALNKAEEQAWADNKEPIRTATAAKMVWGGSTLIGGGPREGSRLMPAKVFEIVRKFVDG